jgi:fucose 4-O-acetylase-like acetyltransferase
MSFQMKRLEWLDALRGLGMIFVIIGHMTVPEFVQKFVYSFHMPLFFAISGYLYNNQFTKKWCFRKIDSFLNSFRGYLLTA